MTASTPYHGPGTHRRRGLAVLVYLLGPLALAACSDGPTAPRTDPGGDGGDVPRPEPGTAAGLPLYVAPSSPARREADAWRATRPADAAQMEKIAAQPQARWFGDWNADVRGDVRRYVEAAATAKKLPVLVVYNIPQRDCGGLSGGGGATAEAYRAFVSEVAAGIGSHPAWVVLEPDALALVGCLSETGTELRFELLRFAVDRLKASGATRVYIDAGHPRWHPAAVMAGRLRRANVAAADGFALNVSNFVDTPENVQYGREISARVEGKGFVIDTSRNGLGPTEDAQWCNPPGRALGPQPTTRTDLAGVDAFLWIKAPGESDGACNGGPVAGAWWPEYALGLARRAAY